MKFKRVRKQGISYLVDDEDVIIATSFSNFVRKNNLDKQTTAKKRQHIEQHCLVNPNNKEYAIKLANGEIYLTPKGETFVSICDIALAQKKVIMPSRLVSVEKLDKGTKEDKDYIAATRKIVRDLAGLSTNTNNPFSIQKSFVNPYTNNKKDRVYIDLYRRLKELHEGYIIFSLRCTLKGVQTLIGERGVYAAMRKMYGGDMRLYVVAPKYDEAVFKYVELNYGESIQCVYLADVVEKIIGEAKEYYAETNSIFKLKEWSNENYSTLFSSSISSL